MIAQLKAMVGLDSSQYQAGARVVNQQTASMRQSISSVGRAIGISFSVAGVVMLGRALMRWASDASIAARNAGILTSEMIGLNRVAIQGGMGVNDLQRMLTRMQGELFSAARGSEQAAQKFERMGLNIGELVRLKPADMFQQIAKAAFANGIPLENIAELFGERLGPNAMVVLRQIAEEGFPTVDAAIGVTADKLEAFGSRWAAIMDGAKAKTLSWADSLVSGIQDIASGLGGVFSGTGGDPLSNFGKGVDRSQNAREKELTDLAEKRNQAAIDAAEQTARIYRESLEKQLASQQEQMQKRLQATERIKGTAPALSSMEQMGASFGGERPGLRTADQQLQVAKEQLRIQSEFSAKIEDISSKLESIIRES
jgi:hypothetical protein